MTESLDNLFVAKTKRWTEREVIIINGVQCCYTVVLKQGYLVHLPGGESRYAHELMFNGFEVILPDSIRGNK